MQQGLVEFGWTFVFQIVNTLIIFLVLRRFLFKPTTEFMENRTKGIEDAIEEAATKNKEAEELKTQYEAKLDNIKDERNQIIKEATKRAEERSEEIIKAAQAEAEKIIEKGQQDIQRERQKTVNELKDQISTLAIMAASKVIEEELNEKAHKKMIEQFIKEVGETQWQN
ncbi:F0F1 ATP synthase subunit B [Clostridium formicaceticum]|uniref:ATP synthase subunit b n=1 Tax=Clostridium formicaceticum TaxID=1497 RepID=A0AAC9RI35_9CLOT|nr:F0F1 ATP synthase subunit B [Clostridium formicaceticum]AOY75580.1 ATP synthase F0 subunit B [Clostridium formicaceticum]ARE85885.1 ATP synthase subunit b, sodium ion specific [Clostridium formicaceticum]